MQFKTIPGQSFWDIKGCLKENFNCVHCTDNIYIKKCKHRLTPSVVGISQSVMSSSFLSIWWTHLKTYELLELPNSCETLNICRKGFVPQKPPNSQIMVILCYCLIVENGNSQNFSLHLTNHRFSHRLLCLTYVFNAFATRVCWDPRIFAKRFVLRTFYSKLLFCYAKVCLIIIF